MISTGQCRQQGIDVRRPGIQRFGNGIRHRNRSRLMRCDERRRIGVKGRQIDRLGKQPLMIVQRGLRLAIIIGGRSGCIIPARKRRMIRSRIVAPCSC